MDNTMELELKHLAPYLPYGLKFKRNVRIDDDDKQEIKVMQGLYQDTVLWLFDVWEERKFNSLYCKPILRPLSDLTKEIEDDMFVNFGGGFKSKEHFKQHFINNIKYSSIDSLSYSTIVFLFKHHFDVFGLIDAGLAIDINTLEHEPTT